MALAEAVTKLAAGREAVIAVLESGTIAWLDPKSGQVMASHPASSTTDLVAGGGVVWAVDREAARAWRVGEPGKFGPSRPLPGANHVAAEGDRLWWTTMDGTELHDFERTVDMGVAALEHGPMTVCAGSVWISVRGGLFRVGTWAAQPGPIVETFGMAVLFLTCADGVLVGAAVQDMLFVLDPSADADARLIEIDTSGRIGALVAVGQTAWVFAAERPEVRLVAIRAG